MFDFQEAIKALGFVLKDGASAAIYGAQSGAGGVILVTTKTGKLGIRNPK